MRDYLYFNLGVVFLNATTLIQTYRGISLCDVSSKFIVFKKTKGIIFNVGSTM